MELVNVLVAGVAGFAFGAVWYTLLGSTWAQLSGVPLDDNGLPANRSNPLPYIRGFVAMIIVAGMMRHVFSLSGVDTAGEGLISGLGIGAFMAAPFMATCYGFAGRSRRLMLIDGGYAAFGSAVIGLVLTLF